MSGRFLVNARAMWLGIGAAISALVVNIAATQHGLGFSPDSASYLSAGLNLAGGQGLVTYSGDPLTIFPPGVSIVVAAGRVVGLDPIVWMRVFNSICIGVTVLLAHVVAKRYLQSRLLLTTTTFYIAWSLPLATVGQMLWSEPPFLAASTAFIAYIDTIRDKNLTTRRTCLLASLASTAFLFSILRNSADSSGRDHRRPVRTADPAHRALPTRNSIRRRGVSCPIPNWQR